MYHKHYSFFKVKGKRYCLGCLKEVYKKKKKNFDFNLTKELKGQDEHIKSIVNEL